jgi:hypothetical protein
LKALLARKKQFEGPKPGFEYLEGAAGPKKGNSKQFRSKITSKEQEFLAQRNPFEAFSKRQSRRKTLRIFG